MAMMSDFKHRNRELNPGGYIRPEITGTTSFVDNLIVA
jgi:hypothetical protein